MKSLKTPVFIFFIFAALFVVTLNTYAKNKKKTRAGALRVCVNDAGDLRIRARCFRAEEELSLSDLMQDEVEDEVFDGELVTPLGIAIESTENAVSIIAGTSSVSIDPAGGITIVSGGNLTLTAGGELYLSGQSVQIESETNTDIHSKVSTAVKSDLSSSISSSAVTEVKGSIVKIN